MPLSTEKQVFEVITIPTEQPRHLYEFGPFRVDPTERLLLRDGLPVPVTAKAFDTLLFLIQRRTHLVEKSELMKAVWTDSFVEEGNLAVTISMLRKALGDEGSERTYIQTVAKRGYRFICEVRETVAAEPRLPAAAPPEIPALPHSESQRRRLLLLAVGGGAALLALLAAAIILVRSRTSRGTPAGIRSLAVLPFQPLNSGATPDYLGLGIADAVITKLGSTGQIVVRSTTAVAKYQHAAADPLAIGREQGVDAILSGHIEALPNRVRVTVQLVRVADAALLWANTFEENPQHIFDLEDEVAQGAAQAMAVQLSGGAKMRLSRRDTGDSKAYELYLEGRYFWNKRSEEGLRRSISYFQQATDEDPQYALAYAGLADAYGLLGLFGTEPVQQAYLGSKEAALKALRLDDSLAEAHTSLAMLSFYYEWDWQRAEQEFRRAIALNPNYPVAHAWYGLNLAALGRNPEALNEVLRAEELDPLSSIVNTHVGRVNYFSRRYDQAIEAYRKVIDLDPGFERAHMRLGMVYAAQRDFDGAIRQLQAAQRLSVPDSSYLDGVLGYAEGFSGNKAGARELLEQLTDRSRRPNVPAFSIALIYIGLGDRDSAFQWLERAYEEHSTYMVYLKTDPLLDPVRSDPRFAQLLGKMRF
jgi:DNA-binding winged helix-turn-helix (wHTH) protein/TolB-like protein/Flp pilus assembly protein TadD